MKAIAVTPGVPNSMAIIEAASPTVGEQDVLVKVTQVGICGTDFEIKEGTYGKAPRDSNHLIIGHEALGQIVEVGPQVEDYTVGDYVVASVRRPCPHERCLPCRSGQNDLCVTGDYRERGINAYHGFSGEYYVEQESWLTKVPAEIIDVAVLLEPLSVVEKALRHSFMIRERLPGVIENAMVLGAGPIGLLGTMLLRLEGINTYVLDRSEVGGFKSNLIAQLSAHHVDATRTSVGDVAAPMGGVDFVLEATGYAPLVFEAHRHLASNGLMCLLSVTGGSHNISVDSNEFNNTLVLGNRMMFGSVNASLADFRSGVEHLQRIKEHWPGALEALITKRTSFDEFHLAFDRQPEEIKSVIEFEP